MSDRPSLPRTTTPIRGLTIRQAAEVALEALSGDLAEWVLLEPAALREHVIRWVMDYAEHRGVILTAERDIEPVIDDIVERVLSRIDELEVVDDPDA